MAKAKRKTLPTNFTEILETGRFEEQKDVFDSCALDAYERGYSHDTALHHYAIKEELARYLVSQGLDINTQNAYGRTPLYTHSTVGAPLVAVLLELGSDVNLANNEGCTPLFTALANARIDTVKLLLEHGADIKHKNQAKQNALEYGLSLTSNASIPDMLQCSKLMLDAGLKVTKNMQKCVKAIGDNFERYREAFNKDLLATTDAALTELYKLFDVEPAAKHNTHEGTQSITITGNTPQEQFNNLWDLLVPPQGPAKTVQGEVIRIAGRVRSEFYRNGGANWDREYRSMLNALIKHLGTHNALSDDDLARAKEIAHAINGKGDFYEDILDELALLALTWVSLNLEPFPLKKPTYTR
ncbi:ankyrin repeat domain-containing protein [Anaerobiospirillum succiniciproducens]|uniref:ankyrin repeat domain-containing protein n=1 Tax=Anaerobiospirillum succiniciproducens TaxID=13335 RepID=UPI00294334D7|nr:ankyrin repeat domain-containing protein [Anaerobiospirillum succiniciproducens]